MADETQDGGGPRYGPAWGDEPRIVDFSKLVLDPEPEVTAAPRKPEKRKKAAGKPRVAAPRAAEPRVPHTVSDEELARRKLALDIAAGTAGALALGAAIYGVGLLL